MPSTPSEAPLRVAFAIDSFQVGGTELNAARTMQRLDRRRFALEVICLRTDGPLRAWYDEAGIPVHHFPIPSLVGADALRQGWRLARFLRERRFDVLHAHDVYTNAFAVPWARMAGVRGVIASRRWWHTVPRPVLLHVNRLAYRLAHRVLANSEAVGRLLVEEDGVPPGRVLVVPNFVEPAAFEEPSAATRAALAASLGLAEGDDRPVIGIVARLDAVKDHGTLLRAAARLREQGVAFRVVVVGDGDERAALERLHAELRLGDTVHFAGMRPSRPNPHVMFDVSVLCSTQEGFPNSVVEAMAAARPVVATDVGGIPDAVRHGSTGLLVPPGDPVALAAALQELLSDPARRRSLGLAGRESARARFAEDAVMETLSRAYRALAGRPAVPPPVP